jgi:hypothetical protein
LRSTFAAIYLRKGILMPLSAIDIARLPELATPIGAYGSINRSDHINGSMFDLIVAVVMILFDDENPGGG